MRRLSKRSLSTFACLLTLAASSALSQTAEPKIRTATFFTIKPDHRAEFLSAFKEWAAMQKKGDSERFYSLWSSQSGPGEFVLVSNHPNWATLDAGPEPKMKDSAGQMAALFARVVNCIQSTRRVIASLEADLSLPMASVEPPSMVRVIRTWVRPEHNDAYKALMKSEILPAAKKAGLKLFSVGRVRFGGSVYEYEAVSEVANWAEMDGLSPIVTAMGGEAAYQKFLAKQRPMIARTEYEMYRLMKDQSYTPAPK